MAQVWKHTNKGSKGKELKKNYIYSLELGPSIFAVVIEIPKELVATSFTLKQARVML